MLESVANKWSEDVRRWQHEFAVGVLHATALKLFVDAQGNICSVLSVPIYLFRFANNNERFRHNAKYALG